jgi:hypothetical protein
MNGPSGFQEVRSSTSRSSTNRLLREYQPQFGTGSWLFLSNTKREKVPVRVQGSIGVSTNPANQENRDN